MEAFSDGVVLRSSSQAAHRIFQQLGCIHAVGSKVVDGSSRKRRRLEATPVLKLKTSRVSNAISVSASTRAPPSHNPLLLLLSWLTRLIKTMVHTAPAPRLHKTQSKDRTKETIRNCHIDSSDLNAALNFLIVAGYCAPRTKWNWKCATKVGTHASILTTAACKGAPPPLCDRGYAFGQASGTTTIITCSSLTRGRS